MRTSIITSTHNRCDLLRWTLGSALAQVGVDLEVIVVDNGSSDTTSERLARVDDDRLRIIRNDRSLGSIGGRNTGLAAAEGEWLAILDDDDLWAPDKLMAQLAVAEATQRSWVYAGAVHIDSDGLVAHSRPPPPPSVVADRLPVEWCIPGGISNIVWHRDAFDGGQLDPRLSFTGDWDVALRLLRSGPPAAVQRPLVAYRQHGGNISHLAQTQQDQMRIMHDKHADLRAGRPLPIGPRHRFLASQALLRGDRTAAARSYLAAVRHGDRVSAVRVPAVLLPRWAQSALRRWVISDRDWVREAEGWVSEVRPAW